MFTELFTEVEQKINKEITQRIDSFSNEELLTVSKDTQHHKEQMSKLELERQLKLIESEEKIIRSLMKYGYELPDQEIHFIEAEYQTNQTKELKDK